MSQNFSSMTQYDDDDDDDDDKQDEDPKLVS